ncbi:hypothetical protein IQ243_28615 [Nostocales cyanobacterium LEGE 11386]|nr:hypothetical protein [Nostocales cyanobacterium LEGE 11386]
MNKNELANYFINPLYFATLNEVQENSETIQSLINSGWQVNWEDKIIDHNSYPDDSASFVRLPYLISPEGIRFYRANFKEVIVYSQDKNVWLKTWLTKHLEQGAEILLQFAEHFQTAQKVYPHKTFWEIDEMLGGALINWVIRIQLMELISNIDEWKNYQVFDSHPLKWHQKKQEYQQQFPEFTLEDVLKVAVRHLSIKRSRTY